LYIFCKKNNKMDFREFYEEQSEYSAFRNDPEKRDEYIKKVTWKAQQLVNVIPDYLKFENILEVGCAMGILENIISNKLSISNSNSVGLDISEENIKVAQELYPENIFFQGTIEEFAGKIQQKFQFERFDLVLLSDIIEHIPDDAGFMENVKKISSYVIINLPLEKSYRNRNRQYGENDHSGHLRGYDRKMAEDLIKKAGFEIVRSFTSNALSDKIYFEIYQKDRRKRVNSKPLHLRLFWTLFYFTEDRIKYFNKGFYDKICGTNYFALLKS